MKSSQIIHAIIVDDERPARKGIRIIAENYPQIKIIGEADNVNSAVKLINDKKPDLVFLDIQMPEESGFELLNKIKINFQIVFVTAYDKYAIRAFEVNALDYLLKPVDRERFALTIDRFLKNQDRKNVNTKLELDDRIFVSINERYHFLKINTIKAICAQGDYSLVITSDGKSNLVLKSLKEWERMLPGNSFIRIHRSTIINLEYIEKMEKWFSNTCRVYLYDIKEPFQMSQRNTAKFRNMFNF